MDRDQKFEIERDVFRKWLEKFSYDECIKLLVDVYEIADHKQKVETMLGRRPLCAN